MTNHEINRAIAEACGWTQCRYIEKLRDVNGIPPENWRGDLISGLDVAWIPNYCYDLNAMHEAEKALGDRLELYREFLRLVVTDDPMNRYNEPAFATARQRAEAFLRALGKWEEARSE